MVAGDVSCEFVSWCWLVGKRLGGSKAKGREFRLKKDPHYSRWTKVVPGLMGVNHYWRFSARRAGPLKQLPPEGMSVVWLVATNTIIETRE